MSKPWTTRQAEEKDADALGFLWLRSLGKTHYAKALGRHGVDYWASARECIDSLLHHYPAVLAVDASDPDVIWGFASRGQSHLNYAMIKTPFRDWRDDILVSLVPDLVRKETQYVFELKDVTPPPLWIFNPYLLWMTKRTA